MINKILDFIVLDENNGPVLNEQGLPQLLPRPDTKTTQDIERLIALNKPVEVIDKFADLVVLGKEWDWAEEYHQYLSDKFEVEQYNKDLPEIADLEKEELSYREPKELPVEPEYIETTSEEVLSPYARTIFKSNREKIVSDLVVEVDGFQFDGDEISQGRMARAILTMEEGDSLPWVLANNQEVTVSKDQLSQALRAAGLEQSRVWIRD